MSTINRARHSNLNVVIVGSSIAGIATALRLSRGGHRVHVLEGDTIPECENPLEAFMQWDRRGAPQVRHTHAFLARLHALLKKDDPDLLQRLLEAGAQELRFEQMIPPTMKAPELLPIDEEMTMLGCRRITFEWVLRRYVFGELGVPVTQGARVIGLIRTGERDGIPVVGGVVYETEGGERWRLKADLVVDASGRRTKIGDWLEGIGARPLRKESEPCGIVYSSRFYKLREGARRPFSSGFAGGDLGYLRYGVFPSDSDIFSLIVAASPEDRAMRKLQREEGFEAVMQALPQTREWRSPGLADPITDVHTMAGLYNVRRFFVDEGEPLALGLQPLGDALCHANPLLGRGCSYAWIQAHLLEGVLAHHSGDLREVALAFDRGFRDEIVPGYEFIRAGDRAFIEAEKAIREGKNLDQEKDEKGVNDPRAFMRSLLRDGFVPAMATDVVVLRAFMRAMNLLEPLDSLTRKPDVMLSVMKCWQERETRKKVSMGPGREELLQLLDANPSERGEAA